MYCAREDRVGALDPHPILNDSLVRIMKLTIESNKEGWILSLHINPSTLLLFLTPWR
jgi:hypothetical protein